MDASKKARYTIGEVRGLEVKAYWPQHHPHQYHYEPVDGRFWEWPEANVPVASQQPLTRAEPIPHHREGELPTEGWCHRDGCDCPSCSQWSG